MNEKHLTIGENQIVGDCDMIRCSAEKFIQSRKCFVLIYDSSNSPKGHRAAFTRQYALVYNGKIQPYSIKFHYDYREDLADFTIDDVPRIIMKHLSKIKVDDENDHPFKTFMKALFGKSKRAENNKLENQIVGEILAKHHIN